MEGKTIWLGTEWQLLVLAVCVVPRETEDETLDTLGGAFFSVDLKG
jgi:hypothetical protein